MPAPDQPPPAPRVVVFAGPNGAGKSTHADAILAALGIETFVNADYISRGLSGRNMDAVAFEAGRIMLKRLHQLGLPKPTSLLSQPCPADRLRLFWALKQQGYAIVIYYFSLANAQLAVRRVKLRVSLGGHDVPADVLRRRYGRSLSNCFALYMPLADEWSVFDNSTPPLARAIAAKLNGQLTVTEPTTWHKLQKFSKTS